VRAHWLDALLGLIIFGLVGVVHFAIPVYPRVFFEQDLTLAYPHYPGPLESISSLLLFLLCAIPVILYLIILSTMKIFFARRFRKRSIAANKIMDIPLAVIVILEVFALTLLGTELFKAFAGRLRPSFFAYCNYAGYRDAMAANDFTEYFNNTKFGALGNISKCRDTSDLRNAITAFPSGHSSVSMASFVVIGLLTLQLQQAWSQKHRILQAILVLVFAVAAGLIASTRTRDYWHSYEDVVAGALLGGVVAVFVFNVNYHDTASIVQEIEKKKELTQLVEDEQEQAAKPPEIREAARAGIDISKDV